jgi:predicted CoA-binding protein
MVDSDLQTIAKEAKTIAIVGASNDPKKLAHEVPD